MKIMFFTSPSEKKFVRLGRCGGSSKGGEKWPPIKLLFAAGAARKFADTVLLDAEGVMSADTFTRKVTQFGPDVAICEPTPGSIATDNDWAETIKRICRDATVIALGPFASALPERLLNDFGHFDHVIAGESESAVQQIALGNSPAETPSVWTRGKEAPPLSPLLADLDLLDLPAHDLLDTRIYSSPFTRLPFTITETSRGCPFRCIFCNAGEMSGKTPRFRSTERLSEELALVRRLGFAMVKFNDESFTLNRERTMDICAMISRDHPGLLWKCNTRADLLDEELLGKMAGAGCRLIYIGVESASASLLEYYRKDVPLDRIPGLVKTSRKHGIKTVLHFIFGAPEESLATINETIGFACSADPDYVGFNLLTPYPGTDLHRDLISRGLLTSVSPHFLDQSSEVSVTAGSLSSADLFQAIARANRTFYLRPAVIMRHLAELRDPGQLFLHAKTATSIFSRSRK